MDAVASADRPLARDGSGTFETAAGLFIAALIAAALYVGQSLLVPLALGILASFCLAPLVVRLRRIGVPRIPAVVVAVLLAGGLLVAIGTLLSQQLVTLAEELPRYEQVLKAKIRSVKEASAPGGVVDRTLTTLNDLNQELARGRDEGPVATAGAGGAVEVRRPVPVEVREDAASPLDTVLGVLGPILGPLGTAGLVAVFTLFILLQREDLRDRAIRLMGGRDLNRATQAIDDAASRVSRYLLAQGMVNLTYGIAFGLGLWLLGVPNALLWGLLAALLRFIPFLGPVVAAAGPLLLALAISSGWTLFVLVGGLILALELVTNNALEPWLYGSSTGLSPVAIIVAAVFWTTLWGPVGLLLATPLTVCLVVLGRHVPRLGFLEIMLGDTPVMTQDTRIYQRLIAQDRAEAAALADEVLDDEGWEALVDRHLARVLAQAERDRRGDTLDPATRRAVAEGVVAIAAELAPLPDEPVAADGTVVLCVGGPTELERAAAELAALRLSTAGQPARTLTAGPINWAMVPTVLIAGFTGSGALRRWERRLQRRAATTTLVEWTLPLDGTVNATPLPELIPPSHPVTDPGTAPPSKVTAGV